MLRSTNFRTVLTESQNGNPLDTEPETHLTQNGHSMSFKVIYFGVIEEPPVYTVYIAQYKNCGLECEGSTTPLSFDAQSLANPREYPHQSYLPRNYVPWATFLSLTVAVQNFRTVLSYSQKCQPISCWARNRFLSKIAIQCYSRSSISLYVEEPLRDYIAQYNNCGLRCEGSGDMAGEINENRHFRRPHSHLTPSLQRIPANIRINFISVETGILALHFCCWQYGSTFIHYRATPMRCTVFVIVILSVCPSVCWFASAKL